MADNSNDSLWEELLGAAGAAEEATDPFRKGSVLLDTYRIESDPVYDGISRKWKVHHMQWDRDLAMQRLDWYYLERRTAIRGYVEACRERIRLGLHPNIIAGYYVRSIEGIPMFFMEYADNGTLADRIRDQSLYRGTDREAAARMLDIAIQSARGLHYIHNNGLIHGDVKPTKILLMKDGRVKVTDLGCVAIDGFRINTEKNRKDIRYAPGSGYTPTYCSLEQMENMAVTRRTDIYSWALSVMEMYLGSHRWLSGVEAGASCRDYMASDDCRIRIPGPLQELLAQCMELNADDRPDDFGLVENELKDIYHEVTGEKYPRPEPAAVPEGAESVNNAALAWLDFGVPRKAEECWQKLIADGTSHTPTIYNSTVNDFRNGKIDARKARDTLVQHYLRRDQSREYAAHTARFLAEIGPEGEEGLAVILSHIKDRAAAEEIRQAAQGGGRAPFMLSDASGICETDKREENRIHDTIRDAEDDDRKEALKQAADAAAGDPWNMLLHAAETEAARQAGLRAYCKGTTLLDTYRIESEPMHGGMGSVWRVRHIGWNTDLAMKRPQAEYFETEEDKRYFTDECKNWINLGLHPNIVACYYVREIDGVPTIFSEWMENGDLERHIQDGTLYDGTEEELQARLLDIAIQSARGLHYAHEHGLIHQDVKPANLLLTGGWQAKAADFGLANARAQLTILEGEPTLRDSNKSLNAAAGGYTRAYCSMEQMDGKRLTRRTDIYSWAVSMMEMYIGSRPWDNGVVAGAGCREYMGMQECRVKMPGPLQDLVAECAAINADDRPHDFGIIEKRLKRIYRDITGKEYFRPEPQAAADTADSLNNRALSWLDLNEPVTAEKLWDQALASDVYHFESLFNLNMYRWRHIPFVDPYDYEERKRLLEDCLVTLRVNQKEQSGHAIDQALDEIRGGDQAPMRLSKVRDVSDLREHEEKWRRLCDDVRQCLGERNIPEALRVLDKMRTMEGYAFNSEYQQLAGEISRYCRKKALRGVRRSVIQFPVQVIHAAITEDGKMIACNPHNVQIYDTWKGTIACDTNLGNDHPDGISYREYRLTEAGGAGKCFSAGSLNHLDSDGRQDDKEEICQWNPENGQICRILQLPSGTKLTAMAVSSDGNIIVGVDDRQKRAFAWNQDSDSPWMEKDYGDIPGFSAATVKITKMPYEDNWMVLLGRENEKTKSGSVFTFDVKNRGYGAEMRVNVQPACVQYTSDMEHVIISGRPAPELNGASIPEGIRVYNKQMEFERDITDGGSSASGLAPTRDGRFLFACMGRFTCSGKTGSMFYPRPDVKTWNLRMFKLGSGDKTGDFDAPAMEHIKLYNGDNNLFGYTSSSAYLWFLDWELCCDE